MIFNEKPKDWRELQHQVCQVFSEMGYDAEVEKKIKTVRSDVEIDVFVRTNGEPIEKVVFIECKFWTGRIPQEKVHAFRTVVEDYGANVGYIISLKGFQAGAIMAANNSVIKLRTYDEFINELKDFWLNAMIKKVYNKIEILAQYDFLAEKAAWEPGDNRGFSCEEEFEEYQELLNRYFFLFIHLTWLEDSYSKDQAMYLVNSSPHTVFDSCGNLFPIESLRDYFNLILYTDYIKTAVNEFNEFIRRWRRPS